MLALKTVVSRHKSARSMARFGRFAVVNFALYIVLQFEFGAIFKRSSFMNSNIRQGSTGFRIVYSEIEVKQNTFKIHLRIVLTIIFSLQRL